MWARERGGGGGGVHCEEMPILCGRGSVVVEEGGFIVRKCLYCAGEGASLGMRWADLVSSAAPPSARSACPFPRAEDSGPAFTTNKDAHIHILNIHIFPEYAARSIQKEEASHLKCV